MEERYVLGTGRGGGGKEPEKPQAIYTVKKEEDTNEEDVEKRGDDRDASPVEADPVSQG
jgi:hypothetical protein